MSFPFYVVVNAPNHIFHCLSNILVRDWVVSRNAPLWLPTRATSFVDSAKTGLWAFPAVAGFAPSVSMSLMNISDAIEKIIP